MILQSKTYDSVAVFITYLDTFHVDLGAAWSGVLVFDACIFGLTLYKTLQIGRTNRRTLVDVLLQDGQ